MREAWKSHEGFSELLIPRERGTESSVAVDDLVEGLGHALDIETN
jgi:hypothetical protein